jgi:hypothetical protein
MPTWANVKAVPKKKHFEDVQQFAVCNFQHTRAGLKSRTRIVAIDGAANRLLETLVIKAFDLLQLSAIADSLALNWG